MLGFLSGWKLYAIGAVMIAAVVGWGMLERAWRHTAEAEVTIAIADRDLALTAAASAREAARRVVQAAAMDAAALLSRAEAAEKQAQKVAKTRKVIVDVGTKDAVGPGVSAALDSLRLRRAEGSDADRDAGTPAAPSAPDVQ